jgi:hypothetical protein
LIIPFILLRKALTTASTIATAIATTATTLKL